MKPYIARPEDGAAWVTGASSGIGRSLALQLAEKGFTVCVTARRGEALQALAVDAQGLAGRIVPMPGDATDADAMVTIVETIARDHGGLSLVVLNAGAYEPVHAETMKLEDFDKTFSVNLGGSVRGLLPSVEAMRRAERGQIVLVASVTGYGGLPTSAAYGASKAALINMAESLKFDLDKLGIRIQVVNPGFVDTPATADNDFKMPALMQPEDAARRIVKGIGSKSFEISFPRRFTGFLKMLQFLPYSGYFAAVNRFTGWPKRPLEDEGGETGGKN
ncbi:SDR family NAD(P)-dependent oxidoreductase [Pararhizobium mangrovi]|uniref:SDR family NAD(P)-dependent oxidoreductase n=1 Tax=Pararhizobium mangrovi TaxID=2590452 RepID=A0A506U869_9HYPH|nr:SDR family NAD(P)-dependent oxidoreductase [Pararhizobium mangrovi]TPW29536.1 SDR family NAD(P)-dependent oxidoreductase [Pararhizobium mangrovi]